MVTVKYFSAVWCGPCKMFKPVVTQTLSELAIDADFVDIDQNPEMTSAYNVRSVPTLVIVKNGTPVARHTGIMPKGQLEQFIKAHS